MQEVPISVMEIVIGSDRSLKSEESPTHGMIGRVVPPDSITVISRRRTLTSEKRIPKPQIPKALSLDQRHTETISLDSSL